VGKGDSEKKDEGLEAKIIGSAASESNWEPACPYGFGARLLPGRRHGGEWGLTFSYVGPIADILRRRALAWIAAQSTMSGRCRPRQNPSFDGRACA
jgi:hypothetical protein